MTTALTGAEWSPPRSFRLSLAGLARLRRPALAIALVFLLLTAFATWVHLEIPPLTGDHAVGRQEFIWTDPSRPEPATPNPDDHRQTGLIVWYPAEAGTGTRASYVPDLETIKEGLIASGELSSFEVAGLQWVRSHSLQDAAIDTSMDDYPLLVLSPGNATNVEFYGSLGEDLASHGYVVVGLNHPFQVTAMSLLDGSVAVYDPAADARPASVVDKIADRVADVEFVLNQLSQEIASGRFLEGRVDLGRIGVLGHSNGGLTAAEVCRSSAVVTACMNIDGLAAAGPFGTGSAPSPVGRPFMYLTKESEIHPTLADTFELSGTGSFRVVVPAATHEQFADGPLFQPGLWPLDRNADKVQTVTRGFARAFFDRAFSDTANQPLEIIDAPTDVFLYGYPLQERQQEAPR